MFKSEELSPDEWAELMRQEDITGIPKDDPRLFLPDKIAEDDYGEESSP